jgi:hypothetical protein
MGFLYGEAPIFCLDNWLTDGGKVSALRAGRPSPAYSFLLEAESTPGP